MDSRRSRRNAWRGNGTPQFEAGPRAWNTGIDDEPGAAHALLPDGVGDHPIRFAEPAAVVLDAGQQSPTPAGFGFLGGRQARGVLFEALDAEELGADRLLERFSGDQRDVVNGGARMA